MKERNFSKNIVKNHPYNLICCQPKIVTTIIPASLLINIYTSCAYFDEPAGRVKINTTC